MNDTMDLDRIYLFLSSPENASLIKQNKIHIQSWCLLFKRRYPDNIFPLYLNISFSTKIILNLKY